MDDIDKPLEPNEARKLLRSIVRMGNVAYSGHALKRMRERKLVETDVTNILIGGHINEPAERESSSWRYRVHTARICVVFSFQSLSEMSEVVVVSCWRKP